MDFDQLLTRFFGTTEIDTLQADRLNAGINELQVQFGLEQDGGRRFAMWCLMYMLGVAPDLDVAFEDEADRDAARDFMDMADDDEA
jgi:hypothetical protein